MFRPNIVLVILDSLRFDRLGISGYRPAVTPVLDGLSRTGINCVNHFSVGCPTQIAFPAMFTSTLPFDYGGYTDGIHRRPHCFAERLREGGYHTFGITTGHPCSSHFGYGRGFDEFIDLIDMYQWFRAAHITALSEPIQRWQRGELTDAAIIELLDSKYRSVLSDGLRYLDVLDRVGAVERGRRRADWRHAVKAEQALLESDPLAIARRFHELGNEYHFALGMAEVSPEIRDRIAKGRVWDARLNKRIFLRTHRRAYQASDVNRLVRDFLKRRPRQPFFALVHYFDLHESKVLIPTLTIRRLAKLPADAARALAGRSRGHGGGLLYDIGLADQDRKVGELLAMFNQAGLKDDTVFLFTADHGVETGRPIRNAGSDLAYFFYDNYVHVPLIVHGRGVAAEEVTALMSHLDLGPTILDLAGLDTPSAFLGLPLTRRRTEPKSHLLFENAGKGRCDLAMKRLYVGVRTEDLKVVCEADGFIARERDAFDLASDPDEKVNLRDTDIRKAARLKCLQIAQARFDTVRASLVKDRVTEPLVTARGP